MHTRVNPCITCTKQGGAEQKMMPIKDEQGAAFFERPFRAQETNAPHGCGLERHFSSMLLLQGRPRTSRASRGEPSGLERPASVRLRARLEQHFSSILRFRGRLERPFRASSAVAPGQARAAISSHLWLRSRLERHFSSILRLRGRLEQHFSSILRLRGQA